MLRYSAAFAGTGATASGLAAMRRGNRPVTVCTDEIDDFKRFLAIEIVVAKGSGVIAERIREKALESGVPLVRDITLARALHAACELGQEIPEDLYNAVARVLVFVDALRRRGAARGIHSLPYRRTV